MTFAEYVPLAMRTQRKDLTEYQKLLHAVCGLESELCEFYHECDFNDMLLEAGDVYWMLAELASELKINPVLIEEKISSSCAIECEHNDVEILTAIQKHLQGAALDIEKIAENIGDIIFDVSYHLLSQSNEWYKQSHEQIMSCIMEQNIKKLKKRYPDGFDADRSINRDERL